MGCVYSVFTMGISRVAYLGQQRSLLGDTALLHMLIASVASLAFALSTGGLFGLHTYLALTSSSSIEAEDLRRQGIQMAHGDLLRHVKARAGELTEEEFEAVFENKKYNSTPHSRNYILMYYI